MTTTTAPAVPEFVRETCSAPEEPVDASP
ncbi:uncharacterized protein METZ01_LOCUS494892, partial [marine metagenome]